MDKAYEGMAKQVPVPSIIGAMERVASRYEHAFNLAEQLPLGKERVNQFGRDLAACLAAGMTLEDAEQLVNQLNAVERQMARAELQELVSESLLTARDMTRRGVSSGSAVEVVSRAIEKGFGAGDMQSLRHSFTSRSAHISVESLAKSYSNAIWD